MLTVDFCHASKPVRIKTLKGANYLRAGSMGGRGGRRPDPRFLAIKLHIMLNIAGDSLNLPASSGQEPRNRETGSCQGRLALTGPLPLSTSLQTCGCGGQPLPRGGHVPTASGSLQAGAASRTPLGLPAGFWSGFRGVLIAAVCPCWKGWARPGWASAWAGWWGGTGRCNRLMARGQVPPRAVFRPRLHFCC